MSNEGAATLAIDLTATFRAAVRLHQGGRLDEAEANYRAVLAVDPRQRDCLMNLGLLLKARGQYDAALALWRSVTAYYPDDGGPLVASGKVLTMLGRLGEALTVLDAAVALNPQDADAHNSRANILSRVGRMEESLTSYELAIAAKPDFAVAMINRANVLGTLGRPVAAIASYRQGLALDPNNPEAQGAKLHQQVKICDWTDYVQASAVISKMIMSGAHADLPFSLLSHCDEPAVQLASTHVHLKSRFPAPLARLWNGEVYSHDKIRVAYVSSDLRNHAVAHLIAGLFERHDRSRFEISAYALGPPSDDAKRQRIRAAIPDFHEVGRRSDLEVAQMLRAAEIDIAVDLNGFTALCRPGIFAHRPAPVQINYLGHPGTMGAEFIDYILADGVVIPPGQEQFYAEQVIRLPNSYQVNDADRVIATVTQTRSQAGLPEQGFVFACFNANNKLNPPVFARWMSLLHKVPGSVLWLLQGGDLVVGHLRATAQAHGIDPDRLVFAPKVQPEDHLARHRLADLFLDTLPYNAHTTASDALWTGLPIITCAGRGFAARVAASLLQAVGLPELITEDLDAYEALALDLATHPDRLADLKALLAAKRLGAPLFDTDLTRRHIEAAYTTVWQRQRRGDAPAAFDVEA